MVAFYVGKRIWHFFISYICLRVLRMFRIFIYVIGGYILIFVHMWEWDTSFGVGGTNDVPN